MRKMASGSVDRRLPWRSNPTRGIRIRSTTTLRILKDRYTGQSTGHVLYLGYDVVTGLLFETEAPEEQSAFSDTTKDF